MRVNNHASQDLAGNQEKKMLHHRILMRTSMQGYSRLKDQQKRLNERKHHHWHLFIPLSILHLTGSSSRLHDPVSLLWLKLHPHESPSVQLMKGRSYLPTGRQETDMAIIYFVSVLLR